LAAALAGLAIVADAMARSAAAAAKLMRDLTMLDMKILQSGSGKNDARSVIRHEAGGFSRDDAVIGR
jgi:hypothetical protein